MSEEEVLPEQSFLGHLTALRRLLLWWIAFTALWLIPAYCFVPHATRWLVRWCCPAELGELHFFAPLEVFIVQLKFAFFLSLALAAPLNLFALWRFLLPALYRRERKVAAGLLTTSVLLFFAGAAFSIFLVTPILMRFSAGFVSSEVKPLMGLESFLDLTGMMALGFGVMFQLPIVLLLLVRSGLVKAAALAHARPYVVVILLTLAAILTPPDVLSQLLLFFPSYLLYEAALLLAKRWEKNAARERP